MKKNYIYFILSGDKNCFIFFLTLVSEKKISRQKSDFLRMGGGGIKKGVEKYGSIFFSGYKQVSMGFFQEAEW